MKLVLKNIYFLSGWDVYYLDICLKAVQYLKAQGHMLACEPSQGVESRDYEAAVENGCCCAVEVEWMDVMRCVMLDDVMCMILIIFI